MGPRPASATVALTALAVALAPLGYLHVAGSGTVHPVRQTVSDYVAVPYGAAVLGLAFAGAIVAVAALSRSIADIPGIGTVQVLLLIWCLAMALGAVFPTNLPDTPADFAAAVHRYSGGTQFALLPVAGLMLARRASQLPQWRQPAVWVGRAAIATGILSFVFLVSHIPIVFGGSPGFIPLGLVERVLFVMEIALLAAVALAARRAAESRGAAR